MGVDYSPSALVSKPEEQRLVSEEEDQEIQSDRQTAPSNAQSTLDLATSCKPGTRFPSFQVVSQSGARPWQLQQKLPSDGRFRVVVFGGDISQGPQRNIVNSFADDLSASVLTKAPRVSLSPGADPHAGTLRFKMDQPPSTIDVLLVHSAERMKIEILRDLHEVYHPFDPKLGWDYDKVFVDGDSYHEGHGHAYERYGVDPKKGAVVVVRPDGYIGLVTSLQEDGRKEVEKWFGGVLKMGK